MKFAPLQSESQAFESHLKVIECYRGYVIVTKGQLTFLRSLHCHWSLIVKAHKTYVIIVQANSKIYKSQGYVINIQNDWG